jgi:predicted TPR repeat methyltransferase
MSTPSAPPRPRPPALDGALRLAMRAHQEGKLAEAEQSYRALLALAPRDADALHYLGVLMHKQGQPDAALALIGQALQIAPGYVDALNNLGNIQKELGMPAKAEQSYRAVLAARPHFVPALNNLGVVLKTQQRYADAAAAYRQMLALVPDFVPGWINLGNALNALGDREGTMAAFYKALQLEPQSPEAYRNLGRALVTCGRFDEALQVYRRYQEIEPDNPAIAHLVAACAGAPAPARASDEYVQSTFDRFASSFDDVLARLDYRAPALCGALVAEVLGAPAAALAVLDAGCGTGLCGPVLRPYARTLDGVDLAPKMLAQAALRHCYERLDEAELTAWLAAHPASYDLIVSADTLCYFGALDDVLAAAAAALRPGGHLVVTLELSEAAQSDSDAAGAATTPVDARTGFTLHPHGRYSHSEAYARQALAQAGMRLLAARHDVLRKEMDMPVIGLVIAARRPTSTA